MDYFDQFLANFPEIGIVFDVLRGVFIIFDLIFLFVFFFAFYQIRVHKPKFVHNPLNWRKYLKTKKKSKELATPVVTAAWAKVQNKLREPTPDSLRLAIIEADGVVDEVLKRMGLPGETFADRLGRLNPEHYVTLDKLWDAHRVRNNLVHTPEFHVSTARAEEAIAAYEAFLKDAKAL